MFTEQQDSEGAGGPGRPWRERDSLAASRRLWPGLCQHPVPEAGVKPVTVPGRAIHPIRALCRGPRSSGWRGHNSSKGKRQDRCFLLKGLAPGGPAGQQGVLTRPGRAAWLVWSCDTGLARTY